ncbi:MAG: type II secretion system protein, partial [Planctomycetota bacterium]
MILTARAVCGGHAVSHTENRQRPGFTLIELLVVV